jgi:hypothetical protein
VVCVGCARGVLHSAPGQRGEPSIGQRCIDTRIETRAFGGLGGKRRIR